MQRSKLFIQVTLTVCLLGLGGRALAQTPLTWNTAEPFDTGIRSSVALLPSGLAVEFHQSEHNHHIWYHCAQVQEVGGKWSITWGPSHSLNFDGKWPSVTLTKEGYVIMAYSTFDQLYYSVGQLSPTGGANQTITWRVQKYGYDTGYHQSLTVNQDGRLIEAHEGPQGNRGMFYRTGELKNPATGDFTIVWHSGKNGIRFDTGVNPHIALNDLYEVLEVHQVPNEELLHYHRGHSFQSEIWFERSIRYDNNSAQPAVALTNNMLAIELSSRNARIFSRTGILHRGDGSRVDWSNAVEIGWPGYVGANPTVATNGKVALATWASGSTLFWSIAPVH